MISSVYLSIVLFVFISNIDCIPMDRLMESNDCPTLCDSHMKIDAISPINVSPELLLISGNCAFIIDPRITSQSGRGFKHSFAFTEIQDMFAIGNNTDIELVTIYSSGTLVQVFGLNRTHLRSGFMRSNVFPGLSVDLDLPIDAAFVWTDKTIVYLIQGTKYWAFEMSRGWKKGGKQLKHFPRNISDFGLKPNHKITSAFADTTKVYFFTMDLVYTFEISDIDSQTGLFEGSLSQTTIKLKHFLKCPKPQSKHLLESIYEIYSKAFNRLDKSLDLIWLISAFVAFIVAMIFFALTLIRYFDVILVDKSENI